MEVGIQVKRKTNNFYVNKTGLGEFQIFNKLTNAELDQLEADVTRSYFSKGTTIYREGKRHSGLYCIIEGIVKIYKVGTNGRQQIIRFAKAGDIIAYRSLLSNELACTSAKVIKNAVMVRIPYHTVLDLLQHNWQFSNQIIQIMCRELRESNSFMTGIAQKSVRERTAEILLHLMDEFGLDEFNALNITLTREDLANMAGTVTETLIRITSEFRNEGILELPGRKIVFLNIQKLRNVANL